MMTTIRTHIRTLAAAAMLALAVVGVPAGHAHAKPNSPVDNGVRCSLPGSAVNAPEDWVFYLPGEVIEIVGPDGNTYYFKCGADGKWRLNVILPVPGGRARPLAGGGVLSTR